MKLHVCLQTICRFLFVVSILLGCQPSRLERALQLSGSNRQELEKVLEYFSRTPDDSLKLKAAVFLIENMPGHYALDGPVMDQYMRWVDSAYSGHVMYICKEIEAIPFDFPEIDKLLNKKEDVLHIKADFLIAHTNSVFEACAAKPWLESLCFHDFCEYVLPYRVSYEKLVPMKELYYTRHEDSVIMYNDLVLYDTWSVAGLATVALPSNFGKTISVVFNNQRYDCRMDCFNTELGRQWYYRVRNIPASFDFTLHNTKNNNRHCWNTIIDGRYARGFRTDFERLYFGKVYRRTFSYNPVPCADKDEYVPAWLLNPFNKDVTDVYNQTFDIVIPRGNRKIPRTKYAYLGVFNQLTWLPVAYGEICRNGVAFDNVGTDVVYLPLVYREAHKPIAYTYPFLLKSSGEIDYFIPDTTQKSSVRIVRKYPQDDAVIYFENQLNGGVFEASDNADFHPADTIYQITASTNASARNIDLDTPVCYRYWRFNKPFCNVELAE